MARTMVHLLIQNPMVAYSARYTAWLIILCQGFQTATLDSVTRDKK